MIEIVFHGNGLILGASAEDILQENVFLESQLRGAVDETICYIPRFIEVSRIEQVHRFDL